MISFLHCKKKKVFKLLACIRKRKMVISTLISTEVLQFLILTLYLVWLLMSPYNAFLLLIIVPFYLFLFRPNNVLYIFILFFPTKYILDLLTWVLLEIESYAVEPKWYCTRATYFWQRILLPVWWKIRHKSVFKKYTYIHLHKMYLKNINIYLHKM